MKRILAWGLGAVVAAATAAEPVGPFRRPLSPVLQPGWTQVQLDDDAQLWADTVWIGDAAGRSVPFLRESALPARDVPVQVRGAVIGTDESGRPSAEFAVEGKSGESLVRNESMRVLGPGVLAARPGTRQTMKLALEVEATPPWVAEVEVALRPYGQEWTTLPERFHLYDFGGEFRRIEFAVPRQSSVWRLRMRTIQGEVRGIRAVSATVAAIIPALEARRSALGVARDKDGWILTLPSGARRVAAVELVLKGVVAPVRAEVRRLERPGGGRREIATWAGSAQVWRMPGLGSSEGAVRFGTPIMGREFRVTLPEGVEIESADGLVAGESLWFVAEKGERYYLHLAGERQPAPGDMGELPATLDGLLPDYLSIGPPEDDPFGKARREDLDEIARRWLPWLVTVAVAVLIGLALRMLSRKPDAAA